MAPHKSVSVPYSLARRSCRERERVAPIPMEETNSSSLENAYEFGCRIVCGIFCLRFWILFCFLSWYHLPCICNSLELEPVILHGICYILAWVTLHFAWYLLHLAMFAFHFAWYLSYFGISTSHLHGICYILVLQTFMWVS